LIHFYILLATFIWIVPWCADPRISSVQSTCYYACEQVCSNGNAADVFILCIHFEYHLARWLSWL